MEIIQFTNNEAFNAVYTIYTYITIVTAPLFALLALTRN